MGKMLDISKLAKMIDYTMVKANTTTNDIRNLCIEAKKFGFWSVCINPCYVRLAAELLKKTNIKVCSVVGFPLGANSSKVKILEAETAINEGAVEIDMVMNIGALKSIDYDFVKKDIRGVVLKVKELEENAIVKVIIETGYLSEEEKRKASKLTKQSGANFVKTSTSFNGSFATVNDVKLIRSVVGPDFGIKASGGIRTYSDAVNLINAGANRLGTSNAVQLIGKNQ
jgi:deoxyribose-phosphate aldolase